MDKRKEFSKRLRNLRKASACTLEDFSSRLNLKFSTYTSYESGRSVPTFDTLIKIAEQCNVSLDWLCGLTEKQNKASSDGEVVSVLAELISATKNGQHIDVHITCREPERLVKIAEPEFINEHSAGIN